MEEQKQQSKQPKPNLQKEKQEAAKLAKAQNMANAGENQKKELTTEEKKEQRAAAAAAKAAKKQQSALKAA